MYFIAAQIFPEYLLRIPAAKSVVYSNSRNIIVILGARLCYIL